MEPEGERRLKTIYWWALGAAALIGAMWWWSRRDAARKASPVGLSTAGAVAVLQAPPAGASVQAALNTFKVPVEPALLPPVGQGSVAPSPIVNSSAPAGAAPVPSAKVDSAKPWPPKPASACSNGWKLTKVSVGKSTAYPSGKYNQWQCR